MKYSKSTGGFYDEAIHGSRFVSIVDPNWVRPRTDVVLQPGESVSLDGEVVTNESEAPITLVDVPDMSAIAPTIEVENQDCKIPADATDEAQWAYTHAQLLEGQSQGKLIKPDANGFPVLVDPPAPTDDELAAAARATRDQLLADCDWVVTKSVETGELISAEWKVYRQALRDITTQPDFPTVIAWPVAPI